MKIIVCGAGIGGLAAAIALRETGHEVVVFERAPEIRAVGAGISLWANAMKALGALGVRERVAARGHRLGTMTTYSADGERLSSLDVGEVSARHGAESICVHRADLQAALLEALPSGTVHAGRVVARVEGNAAGAEVVLDDGATERANVAVGADGIHSSVRTSLFGASAPRYAGYTAWRGVGPVPAPLATLDQGVVVVGPGTQGAVMRCGAERLYWFVTKTGPDGGGGGEPPKRGALAAIGAWKGAAAIRDAIDATAEASVLRNDVYDLPEIDRWGRGRVTLLGDAAHATTPNLGQGGCMAIEDALALAHALADARDADVEPRLRAYEAARRERARFVVAQSRRLGFLLQLENPLAVRVRDFLMTLDVSTRSYVELLDALFSYEPPSPARRA